MAGKRVDPREQFSKRLAGRAEWFWFGYMILLAGCIVAAPEAGMSAVYLGIMATVVMVASVICYTHNSTGEKTLYYGVELAKALRGKTGENKEENANEEIAEGGNNG